MLEGARRMGGRTGGREEEKMGGREAGSDGGREAQLHAFVLVETLSSRTDNNNNTPDRQ